MLHTENNSSCVFAKDHSGQKNYRDSEAIWTCVPAMAKMQTIPNCTTENVASKLVIKALNQAYNIGLVESDFNRNKSAIEEKAPVIAIAPQIAVIPQMATADKKAVVPQPKIDINSQLVAWIKATKPNSEFDTMRAELKALGNSDALIDAHFNVAYPVPQ